MSAADVEPEPPIHHAGRALSHSKQRAYSELAARLFTGATPHRVVAFLSAHSGEGVTETVCGLEAQVAADGKTVVSFDASLRRLEPHWRTASDERTAFSGGVTSDSTEAFFSTIRHRYDAVLVDCGSLAASTDWMRVAPVADGAVLVIEAGRTTKQQVERANRMLLETGAVVLGCVLNKRRYPIPSWLYRLIGR